MTLFQLVLLQAEGAEATGQPAWMQFALIGGIIVVFYFFMIRPQVRKQKEEKAFQETLKKGDKVIVGGAIHGKIVSVDEATALVEVDGGTKLKVEKMALRPFAPVEAKA